MADHSTEMIQGTLDLLILRTIRAAPLHAFGITRRIEDITEGVFRVNPGSLLLAFRRLERDGSLTAEWRATENGRNARYYKLTPRGRKRLARETEDWRRRAAAIARLLEA
jgi:transcriptional regulator